MKISWMKFDVNILDNGKIKLIRKFPQGDSLFVLWVAILCKAMKSDVPGVLLISKGSPYQPEDLAAVTELDIKVVQMGLELFARYNMITIDKYNIISVTNMQEYQSFDAIIRKRELGYERVKKHRMLEKQALLTDGKDKTVTRYSVTCNATDIDKSREDNIYTCKFFNVTKEYHDTYTKTYPNINIIQEYEKMNSWLLSNPYKRKKDYPRFINNWLSRVGINKFSSAPAQRDPAERPPRELTYAEWAAKNKKQVEA